MIVLLAMAYLLVLVSGTGVLLTRDPLRQAVVLGFYGLALTLLFVLLQAPDVAMSEMVVGAAALPLAILLAIIKCTRKEAQ